MIYWSLFFQFLLVSIIAVGGGQAALPLIERKAVGEMHWVSSHMFGTAVAFGYVTPGPVLITATFIGYQAAGILGAVVATFGIFLCPWLFSVLAAIQIDKLKHNMWLKRFINGAKLAIVGLLGVTLLSLGKETFFNYWYIPLSIIAMILSFKTKLNPIVILVGCALMGLGIGIFTA